MFSVALLTRQMKLVRLGTTSSRGSRPLVTPTISAAGMVTTTTAPPPPLPTTKTTTTTMLFPTPIISFQQQQHRNFATKKYRKPSEEKSVKRQRIQARKKKNTNKPTSKGKEEYDGDDLAMSATANQPFLQHQEWVKFQQSISIDGFQTGQTVSASVLKKSSRGGKNARKRREKELERLQQQQSQSTSSTSAVVDLKYPAIRYSEEETRELLKLAYENRPDRAGKRGTRNLKRQARRWKLVRQIRSKYKRNIIAAHERKMEKRSWKRQQVKEMKNEIAPAAAVADRLYQKQVLTRWADTMLFGGVEGGETDGIGNKTINIKE